MKVGQRPSTGPGATCRSCRARIVWAITDGGRKMPVDLEPVSSEGVLLPEARKGELVLWYEVNERGWPIGGQLVSFATLEQRRDPNVPLWRSHFATCPNSTSHRRAKQ